MLVFVLSLQGKTGSDSTGVPAQQRGSRAASAQGAEGPVMWPMQAGHAGGPGFMMPPGFMHPAGYMYSM